MATATVDRNPSSDGVTRRGFRMIGEYARMHPLTLGMAIAGAAIYAFCTVLSSVVLGRITDHVMIPAFHGGVDRGTVLAGAGALLAVAVVRAGGIVVRRLFAGITRARVARDLRSRVVERYAELPVAYHRAQPTGDLLAHAHADIDTATDVLGPLPYSIAVVLLIVMSTVLLVVTDPLLALIGCAILPGVALVNHLFMARLETPAQRAQARVGEVSAVAHESVDGALVVKTVGLEAAEVQRFRGAAERLRAERIATGRVRARFEPILDALPDLGSTALLAAGAWRVSTGAISPGTLVQFLSLFSLLAFPMRLIGFLLGDMVRAVVGRDRIEEVFTAPPALRRRAGGRPLPAGPLGVFLDGIVFAYDGGPAVLRGLSLEVPPGGALALAGATGAGKSTLVELVARLSDPRSGTVYVGGVDLRHADNAAVRAAVAVVFQESFLFGTTIRDNLTLGAPVDEVDLRAALRLAQAEDFVDALPEGLDTPVGERGVTLSGGQRQRIALARALSRRPRVLVLDDATSAVDPTVEAAILHGLRRELDITLLIVAYRAATVRLADSVVLMEGGRTAAVGTHSDLLGLPAYAALMQAYARREVA